ESGCHLSEEPMHRKVIGIPDADGPEHMPSDSLSTIPGGTDRPTCPKGRDDGEKQSRHQKRQRIIRQDKRDYRSKVRPCHYSSFGRARCRLDQSPAERPTPNIPPSILDGGHPAKVES